MMIAKNRKSLQFQIRKQEKVLSPKVTKIASRYLLGPKIGSGSFGQVYAVTQNDTSQILALKRQDQKSKNSQIFIEYRILKQMENITGFAQVKWQGTQNKFNMIVMDMLGPSLQDLFSICGKRFSVKTSIMIVDQMIQRIEQFHNKNYVHRDIKPQNFLMGVNKNSHIVYLIDFGLSKKYRDSKTHQHIPYKQNKNLTGTARYASINAHLGIQQSRRDDMEAIGYVLLYFLQGHLPWQGIKANNKNQKHQKIIQKKISIPIETQCKGLPLQISTYLNYCRSLKFNDKPDYNFLRRILREALQKEQQKFDYFYDWTILPNTKKLDNGKIKMQLKGINKQVGKINSIDKVKQQSSESDSVKKTRHNQQVNSKSSISNCDDEDDCLLQGQENIDDGVREEEGIKLSKSRKNEMARPMDLQDKKNKLYDDDIELDQD